MDDASNEADANTQTQTHTHSTTTHQQGALAAVLGFPVGGTTIGPHYSEGDRVRLTVHVGRAGDPTEAQFLKAAEVGGLVGWLWVDGLGD